MFRNSSNKGHLLKNADVDTDLGNIDFAALEASAQLSTVKLNTV